MFLKYLGPFAFFIVILFLMSFYPTECDSLSEDCIDPTASKPDIDSCYYQGIPLHGKIKFVTSFPDIKVKFVSSFPDLKVKFVSSFPDKCGEWQVVESFPDFKIQVVESFPDIEIKVVESFPGLP